MAEVSKVAQDARRLYRDGALKLKQVEALKKAKKITAEEYEWIIAEDETSEEVE